MRKVHRQFLLLVIFLPALIIETNILAQSISLEDSLITKINSPEVSDQERIRSYVELISLYIHHGNEEKVFHYLEEYQTFADSIGSERGDLNVNWYSAYHYYRKGDYPKTKYHLRKVIQYANQLEDYSYESDAWNQLSSVFVQTGQRDSAEISIDKAVTSAQRSGEIKMIASTLLVLGNFQSNDDEALGIQTYLKIDSLILAQDTAVAPILWEIDGQALHNISSTYRAQEIDLDKALFYINAAIDRHKKGRPGNNYLVADQLEMSLILAEMGNLIQADSIARHTLGIYREWNFTKKIAENLLYLGVINLKREETDQAELYLLEAKEIYETLDQQYELTDVYSQIAKLYSLQNKYDRSIFYYERSLKYAINPYKRSEILRSFAELYRKNGNSTAAYDTLRSFLSLSDSLKEEKMQSTIANLEQKYQTTRKEREISDLKLLQTQQEISKQKIILASLITIVLLGFFTFLYYYRARQRKKINSELKNIDYLKSKLFADISHEFRTPLSLIQGPVEALLQQNDITDQQKHQLHLISRNSRKLNRLVDNVNDLSRLDNGTLKLQVRKVDFLKHLKLIAASFESQAQLKNLEFSLELPDRSDPTYYDPYHVETILYNLIGNAFKYTMSGSIRIKATLEDGKMIIHLIDTGPGIPKDQQPLIFNRYFRADHPRNMTEGIGIGLALSQDLARLHSGIITVSSALNQGADFCFSIPITRSFYQESGVDILPEYEFSDPGLEEKAVHLRPATGVTIHEDDPLLLLVEDNPDMREYLQALFAQEYRIMTAENGQSGLDLARQLVPDLIISDLMMPEINGHELLQAIKSDPYTSHIPFIMLTANHLETEKLASLKSGADDYITKPFSLAEIKIKVQNMIRVRDNLKEKYRTQISIDSEKIVTNETDKAFWEKLHEVIRTHLDNTDFSAEDFARSMHMSRMQLHRKLKATTGFSATGFLRHERLKAGADLIRKGALVNEAAYSVGFTSPFYFTRCFKETFGVVPSEYLKK